MLQTTTDNMINNAFHSSDLVCSVAWLVNIMSSTSKHDSDKDDESEQCSEYKVLLCLKVVHINMMCTSLKTLTIKPCHHK